jgi:hypothetical protein
MTDDNTRNPKKEFLEFLKYFKNQLQQEEERENYTLDSLLFIISVIERQAEKILTYEKVRIKDM